jgi:predicted esterase
LWIWLLLAWLTTLGTGQSIAACFSPYAPQESTEQPKLPIRFELGKRVERFERAWQHSEVGARAKSTPVMERAVQKFFGLDLEGACRELDQAWCALQNDPPDVDAKNLLRWTVACPPIVDSDAESCEWTISDRFRENDSVAMRGIDLELTIAVDGEPNKRQIERLQVDSLPYKVKIRLDPNLKGDLELTATAFSQNRKTPLVSTNLSRIREYAQLVQDLAVPIAREKPNTTVEATKRLYLGWLRQASKGQRIECDLPYQKLYELTKSMGNLSSLATVRPEWIRFVGKKVTQSVRIHYPSQRPAAWIIAFHGAGGSENMFFESYGAGRLIELATQKGWGVVCPHQALGGQSLQLDELLALMKSELDIMPTRVFLVGHSMGAAQAMMQANQFPELVAATAITGGGGVANQPQLREIPFFVAAGDRDFGKRNAKNLAERLNQLGSRVDYREYEDVEHMVIMQAAWDDAFEFLSKANLE